MRIEKLAAVLFGSGTFPGLLFLSSEIWLFFVYCFAQGFAWGELNQLLFRDLDRLSGVGVDCGSGQLLFRIERAETDDLKALFLLQIPLYDVQQVIKDAFRGSSSNGT